MERGHDTFPGFDPERQMSSGEYEQSPETEKSPEDLLLEAFEKGTRFDDEDEKARDYNARLDAADELNDEIQALTEQVSQTTSQLAVLPLTTAQYVLLQQIEALIAQLQTETDLVKSEAIQDEISRLTTQFAELPTTPEQGELLDTILGLIDERDALQIKLQGIFRRSE